MKRHTLLITSDLVSPSDMERLRRFANVYRSSELGEKELDDLLPRVDALLILPWPKFLNDERLLRMKRLRFIQNILAGVDHIPFERLGRRIIVSSNAGAYSIEVGEHAFALLLSAAKKVVETHNSVAMWGKKDFKEFRGVAEDALVLQGRTLGIVGYGGIGKVVAGLGKSFGMRVLAFTRSETTTRRRRGKMDLTPNGTSLAQVLAESDAVVLTLPLTRLTKGMIGERELSVMKNRAVLVNVSRGDIVDQAAIYEHLRQNPSFRYATDVWWHSDGGETLVTDYPLTSLPNFIGTPHISGPAALPSGRPARMAVENALRYLRGLRPERVVKRSEYIR